MEFVLLISVLAATLTQVVAVPIEPKENLKTQDGYTDEANKFKLPKTLEPNFKVLINGKLDPTEKKFTAVLPYPENDENLHCTINYNHINKEMEVLPPSKGKAKREEFEIFYDDNNETNFILELTAKETTDDKMIEMMFTVLDSGSVDPMYCSIKSFEDLGHIHFKEGVKSIDRILFTF